MISSRRIVLLLFIISLIAGVVTGTNFYFRLGYFWGLVFIGSWLLARQSLTGVQIHRAVRTQRAQVGQVFEERYELTNHSRIPRIWIEVHDHSSLPGARGSHVLGFLKARESRSYLVRTRLIQRGVFSLGPTTLSSGDIFGLFPTNKTIGAENSLLVYPPLVDVQAFPGPTGWLTGGEALRRRTHQITPNAAGAREYVPGDPLNRIHWLSSARRNRLIVKEFELDPLSEVWIFVDAYKNVQSQKEYLEPNFELRDQWKPVLQIPMIPSTIEYAVTIAASLSRYFLKLRRSVGLVSVGHTMTLIPSDRGSRQLGKILEDLALLQGEGKLAIEGVVDAQSQNIPRGSTLVLISPACGRSVPLAVETLSQRGFHPVVILLNSESFGGLPGTNEVGEMLTYMKVRHYVVSEGCQIDTLLSQPVK